MTTTEHNALTLGSLPYLGSGIGFRDELTEVIFSESAKIDFLEIIADRYAYRPSRKRELAALCENFVVIPHGVGLSVGSSGAIDWAYLRAIKDVSSVTNSPYYSEHLAVTAVPGIDIGHLSPLWFTEEALKNTAERVQQIQDYLEKPLILENTTYPFDIPYGDMNQVEFFNRLVAETGCGVLLDVTNVFINSVNHGFDPVEFLDMMPLESVVQAHLAGGVWQTDGSISDTHSELVQEESWLLLAELASKCDVRGVILEQDGNYERPELLLEEVERARTILGTYRGA